jgi:hypothetical protein
LRLWAPEYMGWHVDLTYCSMEGKHSSLLVIIKSKQLLFILVGFLLLSVDLTQLLQIYSTVQRWLSTAPGSPTTHWYQLRCVLSQPIYVMAGQEITGRLHLIAHNAQSYTIYLTLSGWYLYLFLFFYCYTSLS